MKYDYLITSFLILLFKKAPPPNEITVFLFFKNLSVSFLQFV